MWDLFKDRKTDQDLDLRAQIQSCHLIDYKIDTEVHHSYPGSIGYSFENKLKHKNLDATSQSKHIQVIHRIFFYNGPKLNTSINPRMRKHIVNKAECYTQQYKYNRNICNNDSQTILEWKKPETRVYATSFHLREVKKLTKLVITVRNRVVVILSPGVENGKEFKVSFWMSSNRCLF